MAPPQHEFRHSDPSMPTLLPPNVKALGDEVTRDGVEGGSGWQGSPDASSLSLAGLVLMPKVVSWLSP